MAFDRTYLSRTSVGQGSGAPKLFTYRTTTDNKAAVGASGYFNGISDILEAGDFILVSASDGDQISSVAAVTNGVVTTLDVALA